MSQSGPNGSERLAACLHLPKRYLYEGKEHFDRVVDLERERYCRSMHLTEYVVFTIDSPTYQRDFLDVSETIRGIVCTFNPATNTLNVKMPGETHVHVGAAFHDANGDVIRTMGIGGAFVPYTGLQQDMRLWLDPARGKINIAIAIEASRTLPIITIDANGQPTLSQHIEIRGSDSVDEVSVTGAPLIIPFPLLFLRNPVPPVESDISTGEEGLKEIGTWVWGEPSYVKL
ncbi:hypothetical protein PENFLA_c024G07778 [Penicillium flavigenum]|uniref:Uncharacterized protein n=1 Tax=Penicillium flavigenum TaxID=254877 RepID=A0A1V6SUQ4_9EURO|nr:hypothetical protein PENFLA_c024G07778 [Penicillium flavigenum]